MTWTVIVSKAAQKALHAAPAADADRIVRALKQMELSPYAGDLKYLRGDDKALRRRVGFWRILFTIDQVARRVEILDVLRRSSTTY